MDDIILILTIGGIVIDRVKTKYFLKTCPIFTLPTTNPTHTDLGS
jgi:hypothetical protein